MSADLKQVRNLASVMFVSVVLAAGFCGYGAYEWRWGAKAESGGADIARGIAATLVAYNGGEADVREVSPGVWEASAGSACVQVHVARYGDMRSEALSLCDW